MKGASEGRVISLRFESQPISCMTVNLPSHSVPQFLYEDNVFCSAHFIGLLC
jgi:hypothetical protein